MKPIAFFGILAISNLVIASDNGQVYKIVALYDKDQEDRMQHFETILTNKPKIIVERLELNNQYEDLQQICNGLAKGFVLLVDFTWSGNEFAQSLAENMTFPYLHIDISIGVYLDLLDSYLDGRNSSDVLVVFDEDKYVDQALYHWIDSPRLRMVMAGPVEKSVGGRIKEVRPVPQSFVIFSSTRNMPKYLNNAINEDLLYLSDRWKLVFSDFQIENFDRQILQNHSVSLLYFDEEVCKEMTQKYSCSKNFDLFDQFLYLVALSIGKVITYLQEKTMEIPTSFECNKTQFPVETFEKFNELLLGIFEEQSNIYDFDGKSVKVKMTGIVEKNYNGNIQQVIAKYAEGQLRLESGKQFDPIKAFYRIGITYALPWSYQVQDPNSGDVVWTGYCADFAQKLSEIMNFDYTFVEPTTGDFGEKINGTWNGVVGDLASGDTDMAITAIIMTADKEEVIDFVAPYYEQTGITIVMRKPVRKTSLFKFMTVLKLEVWLSIVAALVVTGFMIWILDKYSPYSARNNREAYKYPCREFSLKESFWFALTSFTPQGGGEAPKALSGRTLVAAYWLFVVLMLATFTANLAAFLTVERMQAPVQSLEQLARQSRINYTVVQDSEIHKYFINMKFAEDTLYRMWKELTLNASTDDSRYRVWDYPIREQYGHILLAINDSNPVPNASEGFRITNEHLDADFAFIHDSSEIRYEISRNCNLTEVGEIFAEKFYAVAVQQGSHLQDDLSKAILDLQKDRFFESLQAKYWNHSVKGSCPTTDDNEGITLESLGGVFIATLFGLALAMITLGGEVLYYRRKAQKENLGGDKLKPAKNVKSITIGSSFKPVNLKTDFTKELENVNISTIALYPKTRSRIPRVE